jgi:hypothetical protein
MPIEPLPWWRIAAPVLAFALLTLARFRLSHPRIEIIWRACVAVVGYAMLQDQISARLSPAYFTVGHDPIPGLSDPTLLGLAWGFLVGFPGGILLGLAIACCATLGAAVPASPATVQRAILLAVLGLAFGTICAGGSAAYNAAVVDMALGEPWARLIPAGEHRGFFIVACAHAGTYLGGAIAGLAVCGWLLWQRWRGQARAAALAS